MERVVLGFGSNLGSRAALITEALHMLEAQPGLRVLRVSSLVETPPLGPAQPHYLNAAALVDYVGSLESLLTVTQHLEALLGRTREVRWGPRTLDIDVLARAAGPYRSARLEVPHPGLRERAFALGPLYEVAPAFAPDAPALLHAWGSPLPARAAVIRTGQAPDWCRLHSDDEAELTAAIIAASVEISPVCTSDVLDQGTLYRATQPFIGPRIALSGDAGWLASCVRNLGISGFRVASAVVLSLDEHSVRGLCIGVHTGLRELKPSVSVQLTLARGADGPAMCALISRA